MRETDCNSTQAIDHKKLKVDVFKLVESEPVLKVDIVNL